jgi:hypothetical protein
MQLSYRHFNCPIRERGRLVSPAAAEQAKKKLRGAAPGAGKFSAGFHN